MDVRQLTLRLPPVEGRALEDFMPAACNREALAAVSAWPAWPTRALVLHGPMGSGKSHLAHVWAERAGAVMFDAIEIEDALEPLSRLTRDGNAVVEDIEQLADEAMLFHLFNAVHHAGGHLLLTASSPAHAWPIGLADLRSRLRAAWSIAIEPPDDVLLAALVVKHFADRQLRIDAGVVHYVVARMERSFAAARRFAELVDRLSLASRRPVSIPLARQALEMLSDAEPENEPEQTLEKGLF